jgi:CheY-like chemotaxis protein
MGKRGLLIVASVRLLLVDDFEPWRTYVRGLIEDDRRLEVSRSRSTDLQAVEKAESLRPNLILLDVGLPRIHGIAAAKRIREVVPDGKLYSSASSDALNLRRRHQVSEPNDIYPRPRHGRGCRQQTTPFLRQRKSGRGPGYSQYSKFRHRGTKGLNPLNSHNVIQ